MVQIDETPWHNPSKNSNIAIVNSAVLGDWLPSVQLNETSLVCSPCMISYEVLSRVEIRSELRPASPLVTRWSVVVVAWRLAGGGEIRHMSGVLRRRGIVLTAGGMLPCSVPRNDRMKIIRSRP